jgi:GNAT superfamily N-acetyltransferase
VDVRTYRPEDAPRVVALLRAAFGDWPGRRVAAHERPDDFWRWKHERNPHGASYVLLADSDGELAALRSYMTWPLQVGRRLVSAVHTVDIATAPAFRGKGISSDISRQAIEHLRETNSFSLGLPNDMSRSQSERIGWQPVGSFRLWIQVRRPVRVTHRARSLRSPGRSLAVPSVEAPAAANALADSAGVAALLSQCRADGSHLATAADPDYLRWRYEPVLGDYRALTEHDGGALTGLAIFTLRQRGELWEGSVCELFVRPGDRRTARRLLKQVAGCAPHDYLAAAPPAGSGLERTLARSGFVPSPLGARALGVTPYHDGLAPDPLRRESWSLSFGDLERLQLC